MGIFDMIYEAVRLIPEGTVATYGQVAEAVGNRRLSRAVGYALHRNPAPGEIPCHRVVKKDGEVSCAFAFGGAARQRELLQAEGVGFRDSVHVDMERFRVPFLPAVYPGQRHEPSQASPHGGESQPAGALSESAPEEKPDDFSSHARR